MRRALLAAKVRCGNNLAVALAKMEKYKEAADHCNLVLKIDDSNIKAVSQPTVKVQ